MAVTRALVSRSLKTKLMVCFLAFGLLPLAVVGTLVYRQSRNALEAKSGEFLQGMAEQAADKIDRNLFERYGDVQAFAANPLASGSAAEVTQVANNFTRLYGIYDLMIVADREGRIIATNTADASGAPLHSSALIGRSVAQEAWFRDCIGGKIGASQTYYSDMTEPDAMVAEVTGGRGLALNFSAPIFDANGRPFRVWSNRASWNRIVTQIFDNQRQDLAAKQIHVDSHLISKGGVVLEDTNADSILKENLASSGSVSARALTEGKSGWAPEDDKHTGRGLITGYAASKGALGFSGYGWGVLLQQPATEALAAARAVLSTTLIIGLLAAITIGMLAAWLARAIVKPVLRTSEVLCELANGEGDLTQRIPVGTEDEIGQQAQYFNQFMDKLQHLIREVKSNAVYVADASSQLTGASVQLSSASQELASSLEETAASLEEMTGAVRQNADNARHANGIVQESRDNAVKGGDVVRTAVESMRELTASSRKIADIVTTIDEVAFQTNLLALNAAVEAARAGEQGRGFAVVAAEVRNLAQRSAQSAREIRAMIHDALQKVETGAALVNRSGETLGTIVGGVGQVSDLVAAMAAASAEQATGIDQVNRAVTQMDRVTQAAAAQSEQLAATAQAMSQQAAELNQFVGKFRVE